jgi:DNA-binding response OmpR family regulator
MGDALVLIIDDDPATRLMLAAGLELAGFRVASAGNGREALDVIARETPAVILLDIHMPVLDGPGFARELRRAGYGLPIIVLTSDPDPAAWAQAIGAREALGKPFDFRRLLGHVEAALQAA